MLRLAEQRKRTAYPKRSSLFALRSEIGGCWNEAAQRLVRDLVRVRATCPVQRAAATSAWTRRWWAPGAIDQVLDFAEAAGEPVATALAEGRNFDSSKVQLEFCHASRRRKSREQKRFVFAVSCVSPTCPCPSGLSINVLTMLRTGVRACRKFGLFPRTAHGLLQEHQTREPYWHWFCIRCSGISLQKLNSAINTRGLFWKAALVAFAVR